MHVYSVTQHCHSDSSHRADSRLFKHVKVEYYSDFVPMRYPSQVSRVRFVMVETEDDTLIGLWSRAYCGNAGT